MALLAYFDGIATFPFFIGAILFALLLKRLLGPELPDPEQPTPSGPGPALRVGQRLRRLFPRKTRRKKKRKQKPKRRRG